MKRVIALLVTAILLIVSVMPISTFADSGSSLQIKPKKILVYLKPDVTVKLNDAVQTFLDLNGNNVYPIIYNGSTYLPVRSISGLMKEPIEWDGASKTVFIGKTLSNPNKAIALDKTPVLIKGVLNQDARDVEPAMVTAYLKPDVLVMYDFELQTFTDENGGVVYPIIYNGLTYLPIRATSQLMKEPIEWDGNTKTITIGSGEVTVPVEEVEDISEAAKSLKNWFEKEEALYYEATAKTTNLKEAASLDEKMLIAAAITENYVNAQNLTKDIKAIDTTAFSEDEQEAHNKLSEFAESTEYYVLVLENIAYLAAQDSDYSMLADTFLYFAMDSQTKMEEARSLIQDLNNL